MGCHAFCYCNFFSWRPKLKYYYSILLHNVFPGSAIGDWCGRCMKWIQGESIDLAEPWQWLPALLGNDCFGPGRGGPLTISDVFYVFFIDSLYDPLSSQVHIYWILFVSFGIPIRSIRICSSGSLGLPLDPPRSPQWLGSVPVLARFTQQKRSQRSYMVLQYQLSVRDVVVVRLDSE